MGPTRYFFLQELFDEYGNNKLFASDELLQFYHPTKSIEEIHAMKIEAENIAKNDSEEIFIEIAKKNHLNKNLNYKHCKKKRNKERLKKKLTKNEHLKRLQKYWTQV